MKTIILAGGLGTRLSEETRHLPKPMVEIGGKPILWHILNIYAAHGFNDFIIALGYKGEMIRQYFAALEAGKDAPNWRVNCADTGLDAMTGGRLLRLRDDIRADSFMVTYGDGVGAVDIAGLVAFHRAHGKLATVSAVRPPARFGGLDIDGDQVVDFAEKSPSQAGWINGGFFVFEPGVLDTIAGDDTRLEAEPLSNLAADGQLMAFRHQGFWKPMDTLREKNELEELWQNAPAPWKIW